MSLTQPASFDELSSVYGRGVAFFERDDRTVGAYQLGGYTNHGAAGSFHEFSTPSQEDSNDAAFGVLEESVERGFDYSPRGSVARSRGAAAARVIWLMDEAF